MSNNDDKISTHDDDNNKISIILIEAMSKRYYVLFSLKELFQPRIFKTKVTVNKYLKENKKLQYRQFQDQDVAVNFMRDIQRDVNHLIVDSKKDKVYELETAFENIKNGDDTVAREELTGMFQKLELEQKYIELIIAELSLCSDDLEHLNFHGFFERFYF